MKFKGKQADDIIKTMSIPEDEWQERMKKKKEELDKILKETGLIFEEED